ncbi:hypothetical protein N3K66_007901 [Trichothecium roseum]|uniref:Uncharacterized protein n=1 Tax=Trichothecium roseum TaxID=47278 RepID=A0ACC0UTP0_9HYPO|nr:hypothetical protein N3K66_007901 [Trichothecium roseum]
MSGTSRQRLAKRACDQCKIRKIKCSEDAPCSKCVAAKIACTWNKTPSTRGPRSLRARTINRIARETEIGEEQDLSCDTDEIEHLSHSLDIYAARLYPIWPIVDIAHLTACMAVTGTRPSSSLHLARAIALATTAQLKLSAPWRCPSPDQVEAAARSDPADSLDSLRTSFFLHIHHENQEAGGTRSLLHLREAITKAQILRLDREASYCVVPNLNDDEQQLRRRLLWLLFVTERGVAMLHRLPVVLKPNVAFPWLSSSGSYSNSDSGWQQDERNVLPAFLRLVHLFWVFDQSGIFELLRSSDDGGGGDVDTSLARGCLELLQRKLLQDTPLPEAIGGTDDAASHGNEVQRADMYVTWQWMRAVLWRAALRFGVVAGAGMEHPVGVAGDFLRLVGQLTPAALESQGPTLEFKTFEIATAVVDAVADGSYYYPSAGPYVHQPGEVLAGLRDLLSRSRGGNGLLVSLLNAKMASSCPDLRLVAQPALSSSAVDQGHGWGDREEGVSYLDMLEEYEDQFTDVAWPPLDLTNLLRSPSPISRLLEAADA